MPLGAARAPIVRAKGIPFVPFVLIDSVTATFDGSTVATLTSNALTFATGDLLIVISSGPQASTRTFSSPSPNWGSPTEVWTELVDDVAVVGGNTQMLGCAVAPAQAPQTSETVDAVWSGTLYNLTAALLKCEGSTIVRQVSPLAKEEGTGTSISTTFAEDPLITSQIVTLCAQRNSSDTMAVPASFALVANGSGSTNSRMKVAARIGHSSRTATWTSLSSTSLAKLARSFELARPGQEI